MKDTIVTRADIEEGLARLGIDGGVEVHSSLSSFGYVEGGAEAATDALIASFPLVMVPAFTWGTGAATPEGVRIERNGWRPHKRHWMFHKHWDPRPYTKDLPSSRGMGAITEAIRKRPGACRGVHPTHSFAAVGEGAGEVVAAQTYDDPLGPVIALAERGGWIMMLGTELTSCTALHASEKLAGRPYFIRYSPGADGGLFRIRTPGCSRAFNRFELVLEPIKREVRIGNSRIMAFPGGEFLRLSVDAIKRDPEMTVCGPECTSCADMLAGGPIEFD